MEAVEAMFVDHGLSLWGYEQTTKMLFTADFGHNLHEPACDQCFMYLDEMLESGDYPNELYIDDIKVNAYFQFPWLKWTDPNEIGAAVDQLFSQYDVEIFASSHGNVIRKNARDYLPQIRQGMLAAIGL